MSEKKKTDKNDVPLRTIDDKQIPFDVLKYIPEESARHYGFAPISVTDGVLEVGIIDPDNLVARDALQFISSRVGMPFRLFVISKEDLGQILEQFAADVPQNEFLVLEDVGKRFLGFESFADILVVGQFIFTDKILYPAGHG